MFVPSVLLAVALRFVFGWVVAALAFWTTRIHAIMHLYDRLTFLFAGQIAPLSLLPGPLAALAYALPFGYMLWAPSEILRGGASFEQAALILAGQNASKQEEDVVGQLSANGTGNVTAASLDINNFGALAAGQTAIGTYTAVGASSGRTTVLLNPTRNLVLYFVSPTQAYALDTDTTGAAIGSLDRQF